MNSAIRQPQQPTEAPCLDERAAAKYFAVSAETMRLWRRTGKGPRYFKLAGKLIRYAPSDLAEWREQQAFGTPQISNKPVLKVASALVAGGDPALAGRANQVGKGNIQ